MTPNEMYDARFKLGQLWGLGRPLKLSEMGRALRLGGRDPGTSVRDYERSKTPISGPISALVETYLAGAHPVDGLAAITKRQMEEPI